MDYKHPQTWHEDILVLRRPKNRESTGSTIKLESVRNWMSTSAYAEEKKRIESLIKQQQEKNQLLELKKKFAEECHREDEETKKLSGVVPEEEETKISGHSSESSPSWRQLAIENLGPVAGRLVVLGVLILLNVLVVVTAAGLILGGHHLWEISFPGNRLISLAMVCWALRLLMVEM